MSTTEPLDTDLEDLFEEVTSIIDVALEDLSAAEARDLLARLHAYTNAMRSSIR